MERLHGSLYLGLDLSLNTEEGYLHMKSLYYARKVMHCQWNSGKDCRFHASLFDGYLEYKCMPLQDQQPHTRILCLG